MVRANSREKLITYQFNRDNPFRPNHNTASGAIPNINMHEEKSGIYGKMIYYINHLIIFFVITDLSEAADEVLTIQDCEERQKGTMMQQDKATLQ